MAACPLRFSAELTFARQLGVPCVYTWVPASQRDYASLRALRERVEAAGLTLYNVGNMDLGKCDRIHLGLPGRDEAIAQFQQFYGARPPAPHAAGPSPATWTWMN